MSTPMSQPRGDGPYQCCKCTQSLRSEDDLRAHICTVHVGWSAYQCNLCYMVSLPTSGAVRRHFDRVHRDPNPKMILSYFYDTEKADAVEQLFKTSMLISQRAQFSERENLNVTAQRNTIQQRPSLGDPRSNLTLSDPRSIPNTENYPSMPRARITRSPSPPRRDPRQQPSMTQSFRSKSMAPVAVKELSRPQQVLQPRPHMQNTNNVTRAPTKSVPAPIPVRVFPTANKQMVSAPNKQPTPSMPNRPQQNSLPLRVIPAVAPAAKKQSTPAIPSRPQARSLPASVPAKVTSAPKKQPTPAQQNRPLPTRRSMRRTANRPYVEPLAVKTEIAMEMTQMNSVDQNIAPVSIKTAKRKLSTSLSETNRRHSSGHPTTRPSSKRRSSRGSGVEVVSLDLPAALGLDCSPQQAKRSRATTPSSAKSLLPLLANLTTVPQTPNAGVDSRRTILRQPSEKTCWVCGARRPASDVKLFRWPKDPDMEMEWFRTLGVYPPGQTEILQRWTSARICSRHFPDSHYGTRLSENALPLRATDAECSLSDASLLPTTTALNVSDDGSHSGIRNAISVTADY